MGRPITLNRDAPLGHAFSGCDATLSRLQRMVNSTQRNYRDALHELERLQSLDDAPGVSAESPVPDRPPPQQPTETKPVKQPDQFVSSTSDAPPPAARRAAPKAPQKPLPFHLPDSQCHFSPIDKTEFKRCPSCYPEDRSPDDQQ